MTMAAGIIGEGMVRRYAIPSRGDVPKGASNSFTANTPVDISPRSAVLTQSLPFCLLDLAMTTSLDASGGVEYQIWRSASTPTYDTAPDFCGHTSVDVTPQIMEAVGIAQSTAPIWIAFKNNCTATVEVHFSVR